MGVGGHFWDLLKPYAREEDLDFLREKKVAVDLSFWTVQHETAIKKRGVARNPHLRIIFFRTINLFAKLGAYPVFIVDGVPSQLKAQARIERFLRATGIDMSGLPLAKDGVSVERNPAFTKCIQECVELLELLGMPILRARCEAEALCAQLNSEGHVDACITADSDAFLYGATCVIKCLRSNSKEPIECYHMSDIEAGLGLKRKQLVAISLLVGNDHDLQGVPGIGVDTALRFVQLFHDDEILNRLHEVAKGDNPLRGSPEVVADCDNATRNELAKVRSPHCSHCGHPGSKRAHLKNACEYCTVYGYEKCTQKPVGFKCGCNICNKDRRNKELKRHENWQIRVCKKITAEQNFPNDEIIEMYLSDSHRCSSETDGSHLSWRSPEVEALVDFLAHHQHWEPSYIRQRMLPMLSSIFLREMASNPKNGLLLCDQYEFHSIQRVKVRYGHQFFLVKWKRATSGMGNAIYSIPKEQPDFQQNEPLEVSDSVDVLDEPDVPQSLVDDGCWFLLTDENMELVQAAFPKEVERFLVEKELKESKSKRTKVGDKSGSPKSTGVQLSITEFYRSTKVLVQEKHVEDSTKNENPVEIPENKSKKSRRSSPNLTKSVRRRLLFD